MPTDLRTAAQQALEALKHSYPMQTATPREHEDAITALRAALEQQEQTITPAELSAALGWPGGISTPVLGKVELLRMVAQQEQEPVAWRYQNSNTEREYLVWNKGTGGRNWAPLYTHPLRREWRSLSEEEIKNAVLGDPFGGAALMSMMRDGVMVAELRQAVERIARAIEQALKERNNG